MALELTLYSIVHASQSINELEYKDIHLKDVI